MGLVGGVVFFWGFFGVFFGGVRSYFLVCNWMGWFFWDCYVVGLGCGFWWFRVGFCFAWRCCCGGCLFVMCLRWCFFVLFDLVWVVFICFVGVGFGWFVWFVGW